MLKQSSRHVITQSLWMLTCGLHTRDWSSTPCTLQDMYRWCEQMKHSLRLLWPHCCGPVDVGPYDKWLSYTVSGYSNNGIDRWNFFLPCSSPYRSSHWIGRSMNGLSPSTLSPLRRLIAPGSCLQLVDLFVNCFWILTKDARLHKIRAASDLRHDVQQITKKCSQTAREDIGRQFMKLPLGRLHGYFGITW